MTAEEALDGFDQSQYEQEVTERWGADAWQRGQDWWKGLSEQDKRAFQQEQVEIAAAFAAAKEAGASADSERTQGVVERHYRWLGISQQTREPDLEYFVNLGDMYVADDRFGANYGGVEGAEYVRDAMRAFAAARQQ